jgi:hypothetical protein
MGQEMVAKLLRVIRESIARVELSSVGVPDMPVLTRVLAHLWSAHDELEALASRYRSETNHTP